MSVEELGWVVVAGLAAFRVWRLVAVDSLLAPVRAVLGGRVVGWLSCPWCAGFWVSVAVWAVLYWHSDVWWVAAGTVIFALSALVGLFAGLAGGGGE